MDSSRRRVASPRWRGRLALLSLGWLSVLGHAAWAGEAHPPTATQDAVLVGRVSAPGGVVASDALVQVVGLRRQVPVAADGSFRLEALPAGEYLVQFASPRWGQALRRVALAPGEERRLDVELNLAVHHEAVVVTARVDARGLHELTQPVTVLAGEELRQRDEATLGETLAQQPGVSSSGYTPGASRPVIRGLGGDRIRVLQDGVGSLDVSDTGPDHAVSLDPVSAEQIEVVRGPATLLYGSSAVGGVVNVLQPSIPSVQAYKRLAGSLDLFGGTVSDYWGGRGSIQAALGPVVFHADLSRRKTGDYRIPGFAESEAQRRLESEEHDHLEEAAAGTLGNSAVDSTGGSVGLSMVGAPGFVGLSFAGFDSLFGIPEGGHVHAEVEEHDHEHGVIRSDLRQRRFDVRGELTQPLRGFRAAKLRFGFGDYRHQELEGDRVGTQFTNDAWEGRLELVHEPRGWASGSFGFQVARRDLEATGEEAFLPPTTTDSWAVFAFEELGTGALRVQLGARYEDQDAEASGPAPRSRGFSGLSASVGATWSSPEGWGLGLTLARSARLPSAAELYAGGPHIATRAFEIGDPDLSKETSWGADLSLGKRQGRATVQLNLFANRFDDFIYEAFTGEIEDGLDVIQYTQEDARFMGAELQATLDLIHRDGTHLDLEVMSDYVRAELRKTREPLPRIPPLRLGAGLHYRDERWIGRLGVRHVAEQDRVADNELPTDGYTFLDASLGYRLFVGETVLDLMVRGTNLTDAEGRNHVSYLKESVPLPGRDVRLGAHLTF